MCLCLLMPRTHWRSYHASSEVTRRKPAVRPRGRFHPPHDRLSIFNLCSQPPHSQAKRPKESHSQGLFPYGSCLVSTSERHSPEIWKEAGGKKQNIEKIDLGFKHFCIQQLFIKTYMWQHCSIFQGCKPYAYAFIFFEWVSRKTPQKMRSYMKRYLLRIV